MTARPDTSLSTRPVHKVYRSLNKPLTILGIDRRLFFLTVLAGAGTFNFFATLRGGLLVFACLYVLFRRINRDDPSALQILMRASGARAVFDPAKTDELLVWHVRRRA